MSVDLTRLPGGPRISDIPVYRPPSWVYLSPTDYAALIAALADPFAQYALLAGRSGGQQLRGGTGVNDFLKLQSTAGVGAADYISFLVGNAGATEAMRILHSGMVGIGTTTPQSSSFVVIGTSGSSYVMADHVYDQTGSGADSGAIRGIARQLGAGNSGIRAIEAQVLRATGASAGSTWGHEVGVHSQVAGNGVTQNLGLYISSSHTGWLSTGVRNDTAVLIVGEDGWTHAIRYYDTDSATVLFDVDQTGNITAKGTSQTFSGYGAGILKTNSSGVISANATIDASDIANRTRRIPVNLWSVTGATAVPAVDAHGGFAAVEHWDLPDAATTVLRSIGHIVMPSDYVAGTVSFKYLWSSSVAGNSVRFGPQIRELTSGVTVHTTRMLGTGTTVAAPAGADTTTLTSEDTTSNITAGAVVGITLSRLGADGADSNTGTVSIWGCYLEYTSDM